MSSSFMNYSLDEFVYSVNLAQRAAETYYNGEEPIITDEEYDLLIEQIEATVAEHPHLAEMVGGLLDSVGAGVAHTGTVEHSVPMLSLAKKKELSDLEEFISSVNTKVVLEPKVDGIAAVVRYEDGKRVLVATRGDGARGEDITSRIDALRVNGLPKNLPRPLTFEVRGELFMSPEDMEFSNTARVAAGGEPFANPRNATSGTVMRETVRYDAMVSFAAYEAFGSDEREPAFASDSYTVRMKAVADLFIGRASDLLPAAVRKALVQDGIIAGVKALGEARSQGQIKAATDGCVVKVDSNKTREQMGVSSRHPRWAMAYKYEAIRVTTRLLDIVRTVGRTGNIAYTAYLMPVTVDGSVVERATLHNSKFIADNDLRIGDHVELFKAGDIIPRVEKSILELRPDTAVPYEAPTTCPQCGEELNRTSVIWRCETPSCGIVSLISYAVGRDCLDVDGFSTAIAKALVDSGWIESFSDLFFIPRTELATLPMGVTSQGNVRVLGEATANKIADGLEAAKNQPLNRVICALGIRKTGRTMSRRIAAEFGSMDAILAASQDDFLRVEGVSDGKAAYIYKGVQRMREDIERMREAGFTMQAAVPAAAASGGGDLPLADMKVVVTGAMTGPLAALNRTQVQELIESKGGKASSSVSSSTSLLVCDPDSAGSSKWNKAQSLGVKIVTPEEFATILGM